MTPSQIIPILEGFISTSQSAGGPVGSQNVAKWVELVKSLLRGPDFRDLTDLEFELLPDVDEDGGVLASAAATHLIAALIEISGTNVDGFGHVMFADAATDTQSTTLGTDIVAVVSYADPAVAGVAEYTPLIFLSGQAGLAAASFNATGIGLSIDLTVTNDGNAGGTPAVDSCRVWVLIRT